MPVGRRRFIELPGPASRLRFVSSRPRAQYKVVSPQHDTPPEFLAELIHHIGQALAGFVAARCGVQAERAMKPGVVEIREFERNQAQTYAPLPGLMQQFGRQGVNVGLQVGRLGEAFAGLLFVHVIVADLDGYGADAPGVFAHFGHQFIGHPPQGGLQEFLIRGVGRKGFLLAVGFGGFARGNHRAIVFAQ